MNINEVAKAWKANNTQPVWDTYESTQVTVEMAKRMYEEVELGAHDRGNENGMGRHDNKSTESTVYGVTHL